MPDIKTKEENALFSDTSEHLVRPRINSLLAKAISKPLTIVCAGMGCGKTRAVYDFTHECKIPVTWITITEEENNPMRFWEVFTHAFAKNNKPLSRELKKIGYPDTPDKQNIYFSTLRRMQPQVRRICVIDDIHHLNNPELLNLAELIFNRGTGSSAVILLSRGMPHINLSALMVRDMVHIINEDELNFTENELNKFLLKQGLEKETASLAKIYRDTRGWAFLINFVVRILKKSPGYSGYAQSAIKQDISQLFKIEVWDVISEPLRRLLLRLSLSNHSSAVLTGILAAGDESLLEELNRQNAFIRYDSYSDSYQIHHLLLEFLRTKQDLLSDDEKSETWKLVAEWCSKNDYIIDALVYYEKIGAYDSIVSILLSSSPRFFMENVHQLAEIFDRAPPEIFDSVEMSAAMHIQVVMNLYDKAKTTALIERYEAKYLAMPEGSNFRNRMLGGIYYYRAVLRLALCTMDHVYDFDYYHSKVYEYLKDHPMSPGCWFQHAMGLWTNLAGTSREGAPREFLDALVKSVAYAKKCLNGLESGADELGLGELHFYRGEIDEAESRINAALKDAGENNQNEIVCRALFYLMRIAIAQGDPAKLELALKNAEGQLAHNDYSNRFLIHDLVTGWYYFILGQGENFPDWLKEKITNRYPFPNSFENFCNHIKTKYYFLTGNFAGLLEYIDERKQRPTLLFERIELLVMEACIHHKTDNREAALTALYNAYETAKPNGLIMPFIEWGAEMQTLVSLAQKDPECGISEEWLKTLKSRAIAYHRNQARIISGDKKKNKPVDSITLSQREKDILLGLHEGLSRSEIAQKLGLSVNTVKLYINNIYNKTEATSRADMFRIAGELNLL